jgi:hypothetical protein
MVNVVMIEEEESKEAGSGAGSGRSDYGASDERFLKVGY